MFTAQNLPDLDDTIVALSSARGSAARAIVRLSGRGAFAVIASVCKSLEDTILLTGYFVSTELHLEAFHGPISADVYRFPAPRTYTSQDVVEVHLVSSQPILDALIAQCMNAGARAARPGEFTMRAFLAGKLDLTRAEAVLGVIESKDSSELKQALTQMAGGLETPLRSVRNDLLDLLADLEAGMDFADEDIHFIETDDLLKRITNALGHLTVVKKQLHLRAVNQRPFRVVLAGKPNAGKSSLFNALLGKDAALIHTEPGTTRDYLEGEFHVNGATIQLIDTAGVGIAHDEIDATAQDHARALSGNADLLLWCVAADENADDRSHWLWDSPLTPGPSPPAGRGEDVRPLTPGPSPPVGRGEDVRPLTPGPSPPVGEKAPLPSALVVATKIDLAAPASGAFATSVKTGEGIKALRAHLHEQSRAAQTSGLAPSISRCAHHVDDCLQHLQHAYTLALEESVPELLALQIRLAVESLGSLVGAVYGNDLLDRIFSRFCIGK